MDFLGDFLVGSTRPRSARREEASSTNGEFRMRQLDILGFSFVTDFSGRNESPELWERLRASRSSYLPLERPGRANLEFLGSDLDMPENFLRRFAPARFARARELCRDLS